jgi:integrase
MEHRINVTKSKKSRRDIPLDDTTAAILKAHKKSQVEEQMASKVWGHRGLVFTDQIGRPIRPTSFSRTWKRLAIAAGVRPLGPHHGARHGWATLALESGIPMRVVQEQLGHATLDITANLYSHVTEDLARDAVEKVAAAVWLQS